MKTTHGGSGKKLKSAKLCNTAAFCQTNKKVSIYIPTTTLLPETEENIKVSMIDDIPKQAKMQNEVIS